MPRTMSCVGTARGQAVGRRENVVRAEASSTEASTCASGESGMCTAIWSPSKSALNAVQTSGWMRMALPSTSTGSKAWVVRAEHEHRGFYLRFGRERDMHSHLIAVEVRVERRAHQRMDADGLALNERRLEGLDAEPVQRGSAVQKHGMLADHVFEDVPDERIPGLRRVSLACLMVVQCPAASRR